MEYVRFFEKVRAKNVGLVGGKNAALGEMISALKTRGVKVPDGFALTAKAYWLFMKDNGLDKLLEKLKKRPPREMSHEMHRAMMAGAMPEVLRKEIGEAYRELCKRAGRKNVDVAVRSSATAEDLPQASFAGQQESFLNVVGEKELERACQRCLASLFTERAIVYRIENGFAHDKVALSVGVQMMVRSDRASAGVIFTLDPESGFSKVVVINSAFGLGENVVQGSIEPDEFMVYKPLLEEYAPIISKKKGKKDFKMIYAARGTKNVRTSEKERKSFTLSDGEILQLSKWAVLIENYYGKPMDIEWAKDGRTKELFIVQARPETVHSQKKPEVYLSYALQTKEKPILEGLAIGQAIVTGEVQVIESVKQIRSFKPGSILVTKMTSPDWVPIMKQAKGIITDHGGRTSHAAIVSRELGLPAFVGTMQGTKKLKSGQKITLSCAEGDIGHIYNKELKFEKKEIDTLQLPEVGVDLMLNLASPDEALRWWHLPVKGVGLARMEFIINNFIKIHPMALVHFNQVKDKRKILKLTEGFRDKKEYFIHNLSLGIARIAAAQYPHPVIVRMSDFKTNEYASLIGGEAFEPKEENPMLGFRGASRYYSPRYRAGFGLECQAIRRVREEMGFENVKVMIPFCRTVEEAGKVLAVMEEEGLKRGVKGLEVYVMCEIPSNVILADLFAERFDGFSIGSNDLTQLVLGVDRDAADLAALFDERNEAVKKMIKTVIGVAKRSGRKIGICGQAPSDYPDFAAFLVQEGIDSLSLSPNSVIPTILKLSSIFGDRAFHPGYKKGQVGKNSDLGKKERPPFPENPSKVA